MLGLGQACSISCGRRYCVAAVIGISLHSPRMNCGRYHQVPPPLLCRCEALQSPLVFTVTLSGRSPVVTATGRFASCPRSVAFMAGVVMPLGGIYPRDTILSATSNHMRYPFSSFQQLEKGTKQNLKCFYKSGFSTIELWCEQC